MKCLLLLFLLAPLLANTQNYSADTDEKNGDQLAAKIQQRQASEADRLNLQRMAGALQNAGQQQEERNHDYKKSLQLIDKAISWYGALDDTLNIAFNKKYKGHLLVRLGKLAQAKTEIRTAITLYRLTNTGAGVASAQFDLARVFEFESKTDSAIFYAGLSRAFWKLQENSLQTLVINNMMVYHLLQLNQTEKAEAVYQESQQLLLKQPAHWQPLLDFYFSAMLLFRQTNDVTTASHYREMYLGKIDALRKEGITARSYYETFAQ